MAKVQPVRPPNTVDISDDLEKDINIDVNLSNNSNSFIRYHSRININYYNFEPSGGFQAEGPAKPGLKRHTVSLPEKLIAALATVAASTGTTFNELAAMAYESLLKEFGVAVERPESGSGSPRARETVHLLAVLRAIAEKKSRGPDGAETNAARSPKSTPRRGGGRRPR